MRLQASERGKSTLAFKNKGFDKNSELAFLSWETEYISYLLLPNKLPREIQ